MLQQAGVVFENTSWLQMFWKARLTHYCIESGFTVVIDTLTNSAETAYGLEPNYKLRDHSSLSNPTHLY